VKTLLAVVVSVAFAAMPFGASGQTATADEVWQRVQDLIGEHFYDPERAKSFGELELSKSPTDEAIAEALAGLGASHTGRFEPDQIDYYELLDIFRFAVPDDIKRLFPPDGQVTYPGIGLIAAQDAGRLFVSDVYDAGPAAQAGVRVGDEIVAVDGSPYSEIGSFTGKVGGKVTLILRRQEGAKPFEIQVDVVSIRPNAMLAESVVASVRTIKHEDATIGYIHLWSFTSDAVQAAVSEALTGPLADADALVLDLRSRWGGAPPDAAEVFVGGTPELRSTLRDGTTMNANVRWRKPVVAIIDRGTRSGLEVFAFALKRHGIPLVGETTAGAVLSGTVFMLPDDSLLEVAGGDALVDGVVLEGVGVEPDVKVAFPLPFANGDDPQLDSALDVVVQELRAAPTAD